MFSQDFLEQVSTFDKFIYPYKQEAKDSQGDLPLTESQHVKAREYGFKDWQSFSYYLKTLYESAPSLSKVEWMYVFDICNGWAITQDTNNPELLVAIVDGDRYDAFGAKWFGELSKYDGITEEYIAGKSLLEFYQKIKQLSDLQTKAILAVSCSWWKKTLLPSKR